MNKKYTFFSVVIIVIVFVFIFYADNKVSATHEPNVAGWGWSSNIGWISFNAFNCDSDRDGLSDGANDSCPASGQPISDYGVNQDESGNITGYGWSSNVGWISFNPSDTTGCPISPCAARVDLETGLLSGWGKFLNGSVASGWDGWVSLAGDTASGGSYVVTFNDTDGSYDGYAWGADVIGWLDWANVMFIGDLSVPVIEATCTINKSTAHLNENVTWTAFATGGDGTYTYVWNGSAPLAGKTNRIETVSYNSYGSKWGSVTVSSPGTDDVTTEPCLNPLGNQNVDIVATITTGILGAGSGTITDDPNGVNCSVSNCVEEVPVIAGGTVINLTFSRSVGTRFLAWVDASGNNSTLCASPLSLVCTFTLEGDVFVKASTRKTQCDDGIDNDGDGKIDFRTDGTGDAQCLSLDDDSEGGGANQCSDGIDNADPEDTLVDAADPGCHTDGNANNPASYNPNDTNENDPIQTTCDDNIDQNGDGLCDWAGCTIGGVFLPADPTCGGNRFNNTEGEEGDIHEI